MKNILIKLFGLLLFCASLTTLYLVMRVVMELGGSCAEGGPYLITTPCPGNTTTLVPLSICAGLAGAGMYFGVKIKNSPNWGQFLWSALFWSLGWIFFESGISNNGGTDVSSIIAAVVFMVTGAAPLLALEGLKGLGQAIFGTTNNAAEVPLLENRWFLFILHLLFTTTGIFLGFYLAGI